MQPAVSIVMMPKKPKKDDRVWLPPRTSAYGREVDVAMQVVSRAAAVVGKAPSTKAASVAVQALCSDGVGSEFPEDVVVAAESACDADLQQSVLELVNEA